MNAMRRTSSSSARNEVEHVPYRKLPAHVTTWPAAFVSNGRQGFTTPAKWIEDHGEEFGIRSSQKLRERIDDGSIPALDLGRLGAEMGMIDVGGRSGETEMVARDPTNARPRLPRLRAVAYVQGEDETVTACPTATTIDLYASEEEHEKKARQVTTEALAAVKSGTTPIRIAWICEHEGKSKIRHIEYRDGDGDGVEPARSADLEAAIAATEHIAIYSADDLANDIAARARSLFLAGTGVRQPATPAAAPAAAPATSTTAAPAATPKGITAAVAGGAGSQAAASTSTTVARSDQTDDQAMAYSQGFDPQAEISATSAHVLYVSKLPLDKVIAKAVNGRLELHAGVSSNYNAFFPAGYKTGQMNPGAQVLIGTREGDNITIVARMPYAGLRRGTPPAGQLLAHANLVKQLEKPVTFSITQLGVQAPNLPVLIANNTAVNGFIFSAAARSQIWNAVHEAQGWPK